MKADKLPRKSKVIQQYLKQSQQETPKEPEKKKEKTHDNKKEEDKITNRKKRMKMYWQAKTEKKKIQTMESKLKQEMAKANLQKSSKRKLAEPMDDDEDKYDEDEETFEAKIRQEALEDLDIDFALKGYDNVEYQEVVEQPIKSNEFATNKIAKPQKMKQQLQSETAKQESLRKSIVDQYRELKKLKEESKANKKKPKNI